MKNYHLFIIALLCLMLASCSTVSYLGDRFTPTDNIDVYYSTHDVTKPYKVIGHMSVVNSRDQETVKSKFIDYAKSVGADAVIITGTQSTKDDQAAYANADALKYK